MVEDTENFIEDVWKIIQFYIYFVLYIFLSNSPFIRYVVFFEFFEIVCLNRNKTILVRDTLNLITHSIKEIQLSIFFIRDTFLIWLTVYEIWRLFWEYGCQKTQDSIFWPSITKLVSMYMFLGSKNPIKWVSRINQQYFRTYQGNLG